MTVKPDQMTDYTENEKIAAAMQERQAMIDAAADAVLEENMEAFLELAK